VRGIIRQYIIYSFFGVITAFSFLIIIRDKDTFFSCPARIEVLFVTFPALTFSSVRAIDRFFAVFSAFAKFLV
jgi:hypothetical protein